MPLIREMIHPWAGNNNILVIKKKRKKNQPEFKSWVFLFFFPFHLVIPEIEKKLKGRSLVKPRNNTLEKQVHPLTSERQMSNILELCQESKLCFLRLSPHLMVGVLL